jgi:hypothetical protein
MEDTMMRSTSTRPILAAAPAALVRFGTARTARRRAGLAGTAALYALCLAVGPVQFGVSSHGIALGIASAHAEGSDGSGGGDGGEGGEGGSSSGSHEGSNSGPGGDNSGPGSDSQGGSTSGSGGADDGANHDANDDNGNDPAGHDANDDNGVDPAGHDVNDDNGGTTTPSQP